MSTSELLQNQIAKSKNRPKGLEIDLERLSTRQDSEKTLFEIFKNAFITNCHLDEASVTSEELETLEELSIDEILENLKDLINDLLAFKKDFRSTEKAELAQRSEQFENMLQKLEAEVRNHISIEHQLKLHIESKQNKIEELEKFKLDSETKFKELEEKIRGEGYKGLKGEKEKMNIECGKLKSLLEEKVKECERLRKEIEKGKGPKKTEKNSDSIEFLKKRLEEKALELNKIQVIMKGKNDKNVARAAEKRKKKSLDDGNNRNTPSPFRNKKESSSEWIEPRPSTAKKGIGRTHVRSNSDQTRPVSAKKLII